MVPKNSVECFPFIFAVKDSPTLDHLDSDFCWCEPAVFLDEDQEWAVVHNEVTWH